MAYNSYIILSSTGSIGGGLKYAVKQDAWRRSKPASDFFVGLNGDGTESIGAAMSKYTWDFTVYVGITPAAGYGSLDQLETYMTTTTASLRLLLFQDIFGSSPYNVACNSGFDPQPVTGGIHAANEDYTQVLKLRQR